MPLSASSVRFGSAVAILCGTLCAYKMTGQRTPDTLARSLDSIPLQIGEWTGVAAPQLNERVESRLAATGYLTRLYHHNGREVGVLVTYYSQQRAGESMHSPKNCLPGAGWEPWEFRTIRLATTPEPTPVNLYSVQKEGDRMQVLYWYQSPHRIIANEYAGKAWLVWDALSTGKTAGALVRLTMPHHADGLDEELQFAARLIPEIQRCFRK